MCSSRSGGNFGCGSAADGVIRTSSSVVSVQRPGSISAMPRAGRSAGTPLRLSATRATPSTWSAGSPSACRPRTLTGSDDGVSSSSWPLRIVPAGSVPVTTVPAPLIVNERSIHSRTGGALRRTAAERRRQAAEGGPQLVKALAGDGADRDRLDGAEAGSRDLGQGLTGGRAGVGQVGPGDDEETVPDPEGVDGGEVLGRLRHPAAVGRHHEHDGGDRAEAGQHVRHEPLVAGDVDEGEFLCRRAAVACRAAIRGRQGHPGVAEVDRHATAAFLRPPVRLHPGQRADQRRLAVVDVPGGGDHVHQAPAARRAAVIAGRPRRRWPRPGCRRRPGRPSAGQAAAGPRSMRPTTGGTSPRRTAGPWRSGSARFSVEGDRGTRQRDARGAAAADRRVGAHHGGRDSVRRQSAHGPFAAMIDEPLICGERPGDGRRRAGDRRLEGGQRQLVDAQGPGQRVPQQAADQRLVAEQQARLRSPEELVAAGGDQVRAVAEGRRGVGLVGQQRVRREQARADVVHEGDAEGGQLADGGALGEPLDLVVRRVDLEDHRRVGRDRLLVVGHGRAVGGADLGEPRAGGGEQVGETEPVADLDQLAPADDDLPARGQRGGGQDEGGGVVVDHAGRLRVRARPPAAP